MRTVVVLVAGALAISACAPVPAPPVQAAPVDRRGAEAAVSRALDDMHDAAARADEARYFAHFGEGAVFLGTDATERWSLPAFRAYAHPRFAAGKAWSFKAARRTISISPDGLVAWFDEDLVTEKLGPARGSGVLTREGGEWRIAQYNLATVVPNDRFAEVRALLDRRPPPPPVDWVARVEEASSRGAAAIARGDFAGAEEALRSAVGEAELAGEPDALLTVLSLQRALVWLSWARGDLGEAQRALAHDVCLRDRPWMQGNMSVSLRVNEQWMRAFLLREQAQAAPPAGRAAALAAARAAREEHQVAAYAIARHQEAALLDAFFAVRARDRKGALAAAQKAEAHDEGRADELELYVLSQAFDLGGDEDRAERLRRQIRERPETVLKALVVRRIDAEARPR